MIFGRFVFIALIIIGMTANIQCLQAKEVTPDHMRQWAAKTAVEILSYNPEQSVDEKMAAIKPYFTDQGFESYQNAISQSNYYQFYKKNSLSVNASAEAGDLPVAFLDNRWRVVVKVKLQDDDPQRPDQDYFLTINMVENEEEHWRYEIDQFVLGKFYISAACEENSLKSQKMISKKLEEMNFISRTIFMKQAESDPTKIQELLSEELVQEMEECRK